MLNCEPIDNNIGTYFSLFVTNDVGYLRIHAMIIAIFCLRYRACLHVYSLVVCVYLMCVLIMFNFTCSFRNHLRQIYSIVSFITFFLLLAYLPHSLFLFGGHKWWGLSCCRNLWVWRENFRQIYSNLFIIL